MPSPKVRICRDCREAFDSSEARSALGTPLGRGQFCSRCGAVRAAEIAKDCERIETNVRRNLWLAYKGWWKHYTPPLRWAKQLRSERSHCPYCGAELHFNNDPKDVSRPMLDHMDPLSCGGEDSLRNVVYCCRQCNSRKRNKVFTDWVKLLCEPFRTYSRTIYELKHQHSPEVFEVGPWALRFEGTPQFLELDEAEFLREFEGMLPLQTRPPADHLLDILTPDPGPVDVEVMLAGHFVPMP